MIEPIASLRITVHVALPKTWSVIKISAKHVLIFHRVLGEPPNDPTMFQLKL